MRFMTMLAAAVMAVALGAQAQEPPGRAGRLAYAEGSVSVYMDPDIGWEPGYINTPITSENSVWTDADSRAELRVSGLAMRLDETTQLDVSELSDDEIDATVVRGAVNVRVRHFMRGDHIAINTPQARFLILAEGRYRIDADPERGDSRLTVFAGRAVLAGGSGRVAVASGQSLVVWGADRPEYALQRVLTTEFDRWSLARDDRWIERNSPRYVSTYMTGYEDLDPYGEWINEPDYGPLWIPTRVESGWVPYRYGHWAWVRPWGWTWIDDQPWGYAPFHYGRWVHVRDRWAWYPGRRVERPVWAPALVAWVGGSNLSVGVSSGPAVGWYPLSPFEQYRPWYRANAAYVNNVNVNVTIRDRDRAWRYADRQREFTRVQAATVVPREALVSRQPVQQAVVRVTPDVIRQQQAMQQPSSMLPARNDYVRAHTAMRAAREAAVAPSAPASAASTARPTGVPGRAVQGGAPAAAPVMQPPTQRPRFAKDPQAPKPQAAASNATPPAPAPVTRATPQGLERSRFGPGAAPPAPGTPPSAKGQEAHERRDARETQREQERAAQQPQQPQRAQQEQAAREAQQRAQQEQAAREAQQRAQQEQAAQQQQQRTQQERAAREAQQAQERAAREAQQQQQRAQQERAAKEAQQAQERAAREAQQQQQRAQQEQQRAQQERAAKEAQQAQERAAREAQQQQQRAQQEQAQRAQQERAAREAQQQQQQRAQQEQAQRAQQERAAREAQQQQQRAQQEQAQRAAREAQQQQQRQAAPPPPPPQAQPQPPQAQPQPPQAQPQQPPQGQQRGRGRDEKDNKDNKDNKDDEEKGRGRR